MWRRHRSARAFVLSDTRGRGMGRKLHHQGAKTWTRTCECFRTKLCIFRPFRMTTSSSHFICPSQTVTPGSESSPPPLPLPFTPLPSAAEAREQRRRQENKIRRRFLPQIISWTAIFMISWKSRRYCPPSQLGAFHLRPGTQNSPQTPRAPASQTFVECNQKA
jgi:hypothetical protein